MRGRADPPCAALEDGHTHRDPAEYEDGGAVVQDEVTDLVWMKSGQGSGAFDVEWPDAVDYCADQAASHLGGSPLVCTIDESFPVS